MSLLMSDILRFKPGMLVIIDGRGNTQAHAPLFEKAWAGSRPFGEAIFGALAIVLYQEGTMVFIIDSAGHVGCTYDCWMSTIDDFCCMDRLSILSHNKQLH